MTEHITLMGAEQVETAGYAMKQAASEMNRAVSSLDGVFEQQRRFMDDWLQRLEQILAKEKS